MSFGKSWLFVAICCPSADTMYLYIGNRGQNLLWSLQSIPSIVLLAHIKIDARLRTNTLLTIDRNVNSSEFWNTYSPIDYLNRCAVFIGTVLIQTSKCQSSLAVFFTYRICTMNWHGISISYYIESLHKSICIYNIIIIFNYFRFSPNILCAFLSVLNLLFSVAGWFVSLISPVEIWLFQ